MIYPQPQRVRLADENGLITREWLRYLESLQASIPAAADLAGIENQIVALQASIAALAATLAGRASGLTTINFGAFPGSSDASVIVTGQAGILSSSIVNAWLVAITTADHLADEHAIESIRVTTGNIVPGVGFTIYASNTSTLNEPSPAPRLSRFGGAGQDFGAGQQDRQAALVNRGTRIYGQWSVAWSWS